MIAYQFKGLLQNDGWIMPAYVHLDANGKIIDIQKSPKTETTYQKINGFAIPGLQNAHSHAFQYAMVGLTEQHNLTGNRDDFWGWRKAMYQLALSINPAQMEDIAAMLYMKMLRHGYTEVAEFHYVHHDLNGKPYRNIAELGERLITAAQKVGIKITLIPIFYQKGGFGKAANEGQKRFLSQSINEYLKLLEASEKVTHHYEEANIAAGVHSLRAVEPLEIKALLPKIPANLPFHLHISEQKKEVEASKAYLGKRPVEWLMDNIELTENFHLVHATHLTKKEVQLLAKSKAKVVLCPSTEGNLGDGIFPLKAFQNAGGNWSIGTDSHIGLNPFEELRILDYGQRLTSHRRDTFTNQKEGNSGLFALNQLIKNGRKAMGKNSPSFFQKGTHFDALIFDAKTPILNVCQAKNLTSTLLYASDVSMHLGTIVNGKWVLKKGKHPDNQSIKKAFIKTLKQLNNR